jgi:hypothetical protein
MPAPNTVAEFWRQVCQSGECWIWIGTCPNRYGRFGFAGRKVPAHRFAYELENGAIPAGLNILHRCDNPRCVRPAHLFIGTHTDNMRDMFSKGRRRILKGAAQGQAKLTDDSVRTIRQKYANGARQIDLSAEFHVDQTTISKIVLRKAWRHVGDSHAAR